MSSLGMDSLSGMGFAGDDVLDLSGQPGLRWPDRANHVNEHLLLVWELRELRELSVSWLEPTRLGVLVCCSCRWGEVSPCCGQLDFPSARNTRRRTVAPRAACWSQRVYCAPAGSWKGSGWGMKEKRGPQDHCQGGGGPFPALPQPCWLMPTPAVRAALSEQGLGAATLARNAASRAGHALGAAQNRLGLCRTHCGCWNLRAEDRD